ncbi:hypothetical protein CL656_03505 [bacterium]|nr:hypothetical protein [bacterium]|tara:strand:+ start:3415 stop:4071 length:657 start_codon:yes stop_codon:yes gene_type:complete
MQQLKKHQGVIFDCDGTLVLTEHIYTKAYQIILKEHGISLEEKEIKERYSGQSLFTSIEKIEEEFKITDPDFIEKFDKICFQEKKKGLIPTIGTITATQNLIDKQIAFAIASNAPQDVIKENLVILPHIQLSQELIVSACDHNRFKPDQFIFDLATSKLNIHPRDLIIVEDSSSGVKAAIKTQSTPIIFLNGNNEHMKDAFPQIKKIEDMQEIESFLI